MSIGNWLPSGLRCKHTWRHKKTLDPYTTNVYQRSHPLCHREPKLLIPRGTRVDQILSWFGTVGLDQDKWPVPPECRGTRNNLTCSCDCACKRLLFVWMYIVPVICLYCMLFEYDSYSCLFARGVRNLYKREELAGCLHWSFVSLFLPIFTNSSLIAFRHISYSLQARLVSPSGVSYRYKAFRLLYYKEIQLSSCSNTVRNTPQTQNPV